MARKRKSHVKIVFRVPGCAPGFDYRVVVCPDPLEDEALIDHPQKVIWLDPRLNFDRMFVVLGIAVRQAADAYTEYQKQLDH